MRLKLEVIQECLQLIDLALLDGEERIQFA
jgi:hypothetical protein